MKFEKSSEPYQYFSRCWDFAKYADTCSNKNFYLSVGSMIMEQLKFTDYETLKVPLNEFYKIMQQSCINEKEYDCDKFIELGNDFLEKYQNTPLAKFSSDIILACGDMISENSKNMVARPKAKSR